MKKNILIASCWILLQYLIALPQSDAQEPQPLTTPFDMTFRNDEDVAQPLRMELTTGLMNADVSDQPGIQGGRNIPITRFRAIAYPYQYYFNEQRGTHLLVLPIELDLGIDGRSPDPYFHRIDVPAASIVFDGGGRGVFRFNFVEYRRMGSPSFKSAQQLPIQIDSLIPVSIEHTTKTYDDGLFHPIYGIRIGFPFYSDNNSAKLFDQARLKFTPLLDPSQIPTSIKDDTGYNIYYSITLGADLKQWARISYHTDTEVYEHFGVYADGNKANANATRTQNTFLIETRIDKMVSRPTLGKLSVGAYWNKTSQKIFVGPTSDDSKSNLDLNNGTMRTFGFKITWEPPNMKLRRQVRMHTRGY